MIYIAVDNRRMLDLMDIKKISGILPAAPGTKTPVRKKKSGDAAKDSVEISGEARSLQNSEQVKQLSKVRQKIDDGSYFSDDVTRKTAEKIAGVITKKSSK
jgi:hypothetical protein